MKTLLLFRHAKSDWDAKFDEDRDRPLNKRGKRAAKQMGRHLAAAGLVPGHVIVSPADRAAQTISLASEAGRWECEIEIDESLYETNPQHLLEIVQQQSDETGSLMLVGHEPTFSQAAGMLVGGGHLTMKTAAIALIEFGVERWADVQFSSGALAGLLSPGLLAQDSGDTD